MYSYKREVFHNKSHPTFHDRAAVFIRALIRQNEVGVEQTVMFGRADLKAIVKFLAVVSGNVINVYACVVLFICVLHYSNLFLNLFTVIRPHPTTNHFVILFLKPRWAPALSQVPNGRLFSVY